MSVIELDIPKPAVRPAKKSVKSKPVRKRLPRKLKVVPVKRTKPNSLKRGRLLKRKGVKFEPFTHDDIKFAWAAYKRGALDTVGDLDKDMDASAFSAWLIERVSPVVQGGGDAVTMLANTPEHGEIPVGLAMISYHGGIAWPHALWFPDASARNKLEVGLAFFIELKKNAKVLITSDRGDEPYFLHLCKYGVLRKVGKLHEWFDPAHATLFQSVGH